jgi:putative transposase
MPRTSRASLGGYVYHVINRGNGCSDVFRKEDDYRAFVQLMANANERLPMRLPGYCLMPNHFHLLLWPHEDGDLSRWMQWLMTAHVRRYHRHYASSGHVWQGRFKAFPIEQDEHYLTVLRYVERNARRADLVAHAEDWPWSSASIQAGTCPEGLVHPGPVDRGAQWLRRLNRAETEGELQQMRHCVNRGKPFGSDEWTVATASKLGLESTLRSRGRPRKK